MYIIYHEYMHEHHTHTRTSFLPSHALTHMHLYSFSWVHAWMRPCAWCACAGTNVSVRISYTRMCLCVSTQTRTHSLTHVHTHFICLYAMHCRERDTYEQHDYKYAQMHAVDMGVDTQDKLRYLWIYHPYTIQFILHTHVSECLSLCVSTHTRTHTHTDTHVVHVLHTNVICLYDIQYIVGDTYLKYIYKYAHTHAAHERIHVRACPYPVFECGIGADRQQLRYRALQPAAACIMQRWPL